MNLEQQLSNLELSKKLKELEVKQESLWWWAKARTDKRSTPHFLIDRHLKLRDDLHYMDLISAFTVAELGEMLPISNKKLSWDCHKDDKDKYIGFIYMRKDVPVFHADTEANARAKCLIYLLENKLLKPREAQIE